MKEENEVGADEQNKKSPTGDLDDDGDDDGEKFKDPERDPFPSLFKRLHHKKWQNLPEMLPGRGYPLQGNCHGRRTEGNCPSVSH